MFKCEDCKESKGGSPVVFPTEYREVVYSNLISKDVFRGWEWANQRMTCPDCYRDYEATKMLQKPSKKVEYKVKKQGGIPDGDFKRTSEQSRSNREDNER